MNYMEVNTQIINSVKEWVKLDNEMRTLKEELNIRKKKKDNISNGLLQSMKEKEIDSFDLKDGKLEYKTRKTKKKKKKKMLLNILSQYYNGDPNKASELNNYILANREENTKETILRKIQSDS